MSASLACHKETPSRSDSLFKRLISALTAFKCPDSAPATSHSIARAVSPWSSSISAMKTAALSSPASCQMPHHLSAESKSASLLASFPIFIIARILPARAAFSHHSLASSGASPWSRTAKDTIAAASPALLPTIALCHFHFFSKSPLASSSRRNFSIKGRRPSWVLSSISSATSSRDCSSK